MPPKKGTNAKTPEIEQGTKQIHEVCLFVTEFCEKELHLGNIGK